MRQRSIVVLALSIAAFVLCAETVQAGEGCGVWRWLNPQPFGNGLHSVAYGNGVFVAVGDGGTILVSGDATSWRPVPSPTFDTLYGVTWGGGQFVAVGLDGVVLTSPDGYMWAMHDLGLGEGSGLFKVAWGNGLYVAVGAYVPRVGPWSSGLLSSSRDGVTWAPVQPGAGSYALSAIAFGGGRFVGVGDYNTVVTSSDGTTWSVATIPSETQKSLSTVIWDGGEFVALAQDYLVVSADGLHWSTVAASIPFTSGAGLAFDGSTYVATAWDPITGGGVILHSHDVYSWLGSVGPLLSGAGGVWADGHFVLVGGPAQILTSGDGYEWTPQVSDAVGADLASAAWSGSQLVAVGTSYTFNLMDRDTSASAVYDSRDGTTWAKRFSMTWGANDQDGTLRGITCRADTCVAVGGAVNRPVVLLSQDAGVSWRSVSSPGNDLLNGVATSGSVFVAVGPDTNVLTSSDGLTWTAHAVPTSGPLAAVCWTGAQFIAVGTHEIVSSADGTSWTVRYNSDWIGLTGVAAGGGRVVAVGLSGTTATSADGIEWAVVRPNSTTDLLSVAWTGSQFVAVGRTLSDDVSPIANLASVAMSSPDGVTWHSETSRSAYSLNGVAATPWGPVAVGDQSTVLLDTCPPRSRRHLTGH